MSPKNIVGGLVGKAAGAAKNPVGTAGQALGLAKGAVATGMTVAEGVAHVAADRLRARQGKGAEKVHVSPDQPVSDQGSGGGAEQEAGSASAASKATEAVKKAPAAAKKAGTAAKKSTPAKKAPAKKAPAKKGPAGKAASKKAAAGPPEPQVVLAEPAPPAEPPVDIVEQVLAAEAEADPVAMAGGHATEPKAASRDESHGDAAMQRAEFDEIAEEQAEALPGGDLDIETPVGTTGADVGHNPDTAEADLQQPGTEPLVDPATTKAVKSETETGRAASRTRKR